MNKIASQVESYLHYKQGLGFQMLSESVCLRAFAKYTEELSYGGSVTRKIVSKWCERAPCDANLLLDKLSCGN